MLLDVLPDSRLGSEVGAVMYDWPLPDGTVVRTEMVPIFCANCGLANGYVPKDNTTFACWLCEKCYEDYGTIAGTMVLPDTQFWLEVEQEMIAQYGHPLNQFELSLLAEQGWGKLAKLVKDSPIKVRN